MRAGRLREGGLYIQIPDIPPELLARVPAEQRGPGLGRDAVRLLVSGGGGDVSLHAFPELPELLRAGDVLVVNTSTTLAAAVDARLGGEELVVHFSTRGDDGRWAVELRAPAGGGTTRPRAGVPRGRWWSCRAGVPSYWRSRWRRGGPAVVGAAGTGGAAGGRRRAAGRRAGAAAGVRAADPVRVHGAGPAAVGLPDGVRGAGRRRVGLGGDAECGAALHGGAGGAAGEPGVQFAPLTLHTGVASQEAHEPPYPERYEVPATTAWLVNAARASGGG